MNNGTIQDVRQRHAETANAGPSRVARPYRSHKQPACDNCRDQKTGCVREDPSQPCRHCRERLWTCVISKRGAHSASEPRRQRRRQQKRRHQESRSLSPTADASQSLWNDISPADAPLIVGPALADDVQILERYLTSRRSTARRSTAKTYNTVSNTPGNPIVYLRVQRRREGLNVAKDPGKAQLELMEQILGPSKNELLMLYFEHIHPCFPILDEYTFHELHERCDERLSPALLCIMYALTLPLWYRSEVLNQHWRPDIQHAWNQAVAALQEDFMAPSMATVYAALLDLVGRPIKSINGNILTVGRTVALAHSLGLNRDPSSWKATVNEKHLRIRVWWGVLIHDHWSSFAHGTPPHILRDRYDVPLPSQEAMPALAAESSESFRYLCSLTVVLGDILPVVYSLSKDYEAVWQQLTYVKRSLDDWEAAFPSSLNPTGEGSSVHCVSGSSSLWFSFLSVKLLLQRVLLRVMLQQHGAPYAEGKADQLTQLCKVRDAALEVATYVSNMHGNQFREFWLPYTAHLLVSATTILLRCTIETSDRDVSRRCIAQLVRLRDGLQEASEDYEWDLAEFCLQRCSDAITKVARAPTPAGRGSQQPTDADALSGAEPTGQDIGDVDVATQSFEPADLFFPVESLDYPWENLWDTLEGPSTISI